jgi:hypothetical protein
MTRRNLLLAAFFFGATIGGFWVIAVDRGRNYATWPPNQDAWYARMSCPFIPFIGRNNLLSLSVPILNGLMYGSILWGVFRFLRSKDSQQ